MTDFPILRDLGAVLLAAAAVLFIARAARVPPILAYIVAGLLLGPVIGLVEVGPSLELVSEVGIALLLFLVGMELSLDRIRDVGRVAVVAGVLQVVLTTSAGLALAVLLGARGAEAQILALSVTFSSTVVVVKVLQVRGETASVHGRIAVGILLVQDIAVAIVLTLVAGLAGQETELVPGVLRAVAGMAALLAVAFASARWLLPHLFRRLGTSLEAAFVFTVAWCFLFIVGAELFHLSVEIGAFTAGVSLAQTGVHEDLVRRMHPLVNLFLAVFFVSLGIQLDPGSAAAQWPVGLALGVLVLVGKPALVFVLVRWSGYAAQTAFRAALSLGQMSEFSFVLAALAAASGAIPPETLSLIGVTGLATIAVSAAFLQAPERVQSLFARVPAFRSLASAQAGPAEPPLADHIVIVGMNSLGRRLVRAFVQRGERVLAIDTDPSKLAGLPGSHLVGSTDYRSVFEEAHAEDAKLVVSALQIEDANSLLAWRARRAGVATSIHAFDAAVIPELEAIGVSHLMVSKHDGIRQVAAALREAGVID